MKKHAGWIIAVLGLFAAAAAGYIAASRFLHLNNTKKAVHEKIKPEPKAIVSLAPSITEILFSLDLGDRVVGVTRFCLYPPEASSRTKIGGYFDINLEAVVSLEPDLVIGLSEHEEARSTLSGLGIRFLTVRHTSLDGIMDSISIIGNECYRQKQASELLKSIRSRINDVASRVKELPRPTVLICVDRPMGHGITGDIYAAGADDYYDKMILLAGGTNVLGNAKTRYPVLGAEALVRLDPDIIIDLHPELDEQERKTATDDWNNFPGKNGRPRGKLVLLTEKYMIIPGPRFIDAIEEFSRIFHPELN